MREGNLLKPRSDRKRAVPTQRVPGCPMIHGKATWCRGLCTPIHGRGVCGRQAPHAMRSRIQRAIAAEKRRQERTRLAQNS